MRVAAAVLALGVLVFASVTGLQDPSFVWPEAHEPGDAVAFVGEARLVPFATGLDRPLAGISDGSGRFFIVEQTGRVWEFRDGQRSAQPYLDLAARVGTCHYEQGLLGLAFSPDFATSGRLYVAYTGLPCEGGSAKGPLLLSRFTAAPGAATVDAASEQELLRIPKPYRNHSGGHLAFGLDGMLYLGVGDGGDHGDPHRNGQDLGTLLGKILRVDVSGNGLVIPPDNPFVGQPGLRGEIWAYGLRNPWGFTFDPANGDLWVADVGQDLAEEVDWLPAGAARGANLGWSLYEGLERFNSGPVPRDLVFPAVQYRHGGDHCAIVGGPVVRGAGVADLEGAYLFGDFCSGWLWAVVREDEGFRMVEVMDTGLQITGFGQDDAGHVYLMHWDGSAFRLDLGVEADSDGAA